MEFFTSPGTYRFQFPFLGNVNDIGHCEVKLYVGSNTEINKGTEFLATVVVTSSTSTAPPLAQFIEEVCSNIRRVFFPRLLGEEIKNHSQLIPEELIRWIQVIPFYKNGKPIQITMTWDPKSEVYHSPGWTELDNFENL